MGRVKFQCNGDIRWHWWRDSTNQWYTYKYDEWTLVSEYNYLFWNVNNCIYQYIKIYYANMIICNWIIISHVTVVKHVKFIVLIFKICKDLNKIKMSICYNLLSEKKFVCILNLKVVPKSKISSLNKKE